MGHALRGRAAVAQRNFQGCSDERGSRQEYHVFGFLQLSTRRQKAHGLCVRAANPFSTAPPAAEEGLTVHVTARAGSSLLSGGHQTRKKGSACLLQCSCDSCPALRDDCVIAKGNWRASCARTSTAQVFDVHVRAPTHLLSEAKGVPKGKQRCSNDTVRIAYLTSSLPTAGDNSSILALDSFLSQPDFYTIHVFV